MSSPESMSYDEHYSRLKAIHTQMQAQRETSVDKIVAQVREALESHAFCKARIKAGTEDLNKMLGDDTDGATA